ncbi:hypothetical protein RvY_05010 [Ramazzottius varieornatus]|uniref:G-protein coupled receptors family 2 profile 2 domain-containing protein n=1 Tax=Ramazzottius varieornatus TaxID=947166 RepID=A0A1D1UWN9_RAMVA|nr:hypothetical protein RvY_05010 [Ramazzottius varieornatus]
MDFWVLRMILLIRLTVVRTDPSQYGLPPSCSTFDVDCSMDNSGSTVTGRLMAGGNTGRCFCDPHCSVYQDCCSPSLDPTTVAEERSQEKCIALPYVSENDYTGIYAETTCADSSACPFSANDQLASLPAFSKSSNQTYLNLFCALCNEESYQDLVFGKLDVKCDEEVGEKNILLYFNRETEEGKSDLGDQIRKMCTPSYRIPDGQPATKCLRAVDTCLNGASAADENFCRSYLRPFFWQGTVLYRNLHCAQCAGLNLSLLEINDCLSPMLSLLGDLQSHGGDLSAKDIFDRGFAGYSMTILLDLNLDNGNVVGTQRKCPDGQVFDPWQNLCRPVMCPEGQAYREGSCRKNKPSRAGKTPTKLPVITAGPSRNSSGLNNEELDELQQDHVVHVSVHNHSLYGRENKSTVSQALVNTCPRIDLLPGEYTISGNFLYTIPSQQKFNLSEVMFISEDIVSVCLTDGLTNGQYVDINSDAKIILSVVCYALSILCLLLHFTVYILAGKTRMVPDLTLLSISASIFFGQLFLLLSPIIQQQFLVDSPLCKASAVLLHYFILCIFTWSSVVAYDITKSVMSLEHSSFSSTEYSSFWRYSLFAWSTPAVFVIIGLTMDQVIPYNPFSPAYGQHICWISRRKSLWVLLGAQLACVILANFVLYCITASALWRSHRLRLTLAVSSQVHATPPKERFRLYVKLAMIMGLAWIIGFFSIEIPVFGYVYILANGLQGVYIFAAFSCKRSVFQGVIKQDVFSTLPKRFSSSGSKKSALSHLSSLSAERSRKSSLQVNQIISCRKSIDIHSPPNRC